MKYEDAVELLIIEAESRRLSPQTIRFYRERLLGAAKTLCGREVEGITVFDLRQVIGKASVGSAPHIHQVLRRLFRFLESEELIKTNPARRFAAPKSVVKAIEPLTTEQISRLYATAKERGGYLGLRNSVIIATLVGTGLRRAELCNLRDEDVRLREGFILVSGKGGRQRIVPLPSSLRLLLARYRSQRDCLKSAGRSNFFFRSRHGGQVSLEDLSGLVRETGRQAGVAAHTHKLRHTFASAYMENDGAEILALRALCGWSTLAMAQRYAHASLPKLQRSMEAFSPANRLRN